jgi:polysaccharide export outer membrane protein
MKTSLLLTFSAIMFSFFMLSGCCSSNPRDIAAWKKPYQVNVTSDKYILEPPDQIQIVSSIRDLNSPPQTIRPDGKVSFPNIGEVEVAGRTPSQAADMIREKASKLYIMTGEHPVDVKIAVYQSSVYYVLGQVDRPGPRLYSGRSSALRAIADANPNLIAWTDRIQVIRPSYDASVEPKVFELCWRPMVAKGYACRDVLLEEGDIIYVPPTIIGSIALKVAEFVMPITQAFTVPAAVPGATATAVTY